MTLEETLDRWLRNRPVLWGSAAALLAAVAALTRLDPDSAGVWLVTLAAAGLAIALSRTEQGDARQTMLALALVGGAVRAVSHAALTAWSEAAGGSLLGLDSSSYFFRSVLLAREGFRTIESPALHFGTYDAAHYYLFAAVIGVLGPSLVTLQAMNWSMTTLAGPLAYAIARRTAPAHARTAGLLVALHPSIVAISVNDLLKDPSVIFLSLVAVWALVRLARTPWTPTASAGLVLAGAVALSYVRMSRFYVSAFLLAAAFVAIGWGWRQARSGAAAATRPAAVLSILLVFGLSEAGPRVMGWPFSPVMAVRQFVRVLNTPSMRVYAPGLVSRFSGGSAATHDTAEPATLPAWGPSLPVNEGQAYTASEVLARASDRAWAPTSTSSLHAPAARPPERAPAGAAEQAAAPATSGGAGAESPAGGHRVVRWAANGFRKLFGPFPWVPPPDFSVSTITRGDYLLFPGMLLWYALLPVALSAMALVFGDALRGRAESLTLGLALFTGGLFALYLALNLSWRQREFLFPFFVLLSAATIDRLRTSRLAGYAYALYWFGLVTVAVAHTALRTLVA